MVNIEHSPSCQELRRDTKTKDKSMGWLTPEQREAVLACPHRDHDTVRFMFGRRL